MVGEGLGLGQPSWADQVSEQNLLLGPSDRSPSTAAREGSAGHGGGGLQLSTQGLFPRKGKCYAGQGAKFSPRARGKASGMSHQFKS